MSTAAGEPEWMIQWAPMARKWEGEKMGPSHRRHTGVEVGVWRPRKGW